MCNNGKSHHKSTYHRFPRTHKHTLTHNSLVGAFLKFRMCINIILRRPIVGKLQYDTLKSFLSIFANLSKRTIIRLSALYQANEQLSTQFYMVSCNCIISISRCTDHPIFRCVETGDKINDENACTLRA